MPNSKTHHASPQADIQNEFQKESAQNALLHFMNSAHKLLQDTSLSAHKKQNSNPKSRFLPSELLFNTPSNKYANAPSKRNRWQSIFEPNLQFTHRLRRIPFLGYGLALIKSFLTLPKLVTRLSLLEQSYAKQVQKDIILNQFLNKTVMTTDSRLRNFENLSIGKRLMEIDKLMLQKQLNELRKNVIAFQKLNSLHSSQQQNPSTLSDTSTSPTTQGLGVSYQDFYVAFENEFRGSKEDIKSRLEVYIPIIEQSPRNDEGKFRDMIDIGCGRGEWLELLYEHDFNGLGIDLNRAMVEHCGNLGFNAICEDAITYLKKLPQASVGVITGFHIIEHIPFEKLLELFDAAHHALCDGGIVIFETPNPENLRVGAYSFYKDPTHINPLVPCVVHFMAKQRGFSQAEILRLHPFPDASTIKENSYIAEILNKELFGPQDYALIARK